MALTRRERTLQKYKLSTAEYDAMLDKQGGACAICHDTSPGPGFIHFMVDHSHDCCHSEITCGLCVRGLLCSYCNTLVGRYERLNERGRLDEYLSQRTRGEL